MIVEENMVNNLDRWRKFVRRLDFALLDRKNSQFAEPRHFIRCWLLVTHKRKNVSV